MILANEEVQHALNVLNRHDMQSEYFFGVWKTIEKDGLPQLSPASQVDEETSVECLIVNDKDEISQAYRSLDERDDGAPWFLHIFNSYVSDKEITCYLELSWMVRKEDGSYERKAY